MIFLGILLMPFVAPLVTLAGYAVVRRGLLSALLAWLLCCGIYAYRSLPPHDLTWENWGLLAILGSFMSLPYALVTGIWLDAERGKAPKSP